MICSLKFWARMAAINAAAALTVGFAFNGVTLHTPWRRAAGDHGRRVPLLVDHQLAVRRHHLGDGADALHASVRFPFNWTILMAVLVALSAIGSVLALLVLLAIGYLHSRQEFVRYLFGHAEGVGDHHAGVRDLRDADRAAAGPARTTRRSRCAPRSATRPTRGGWRPRRSWRRSNRGCSRTFSSTRSTRSRRWCTTIRLAPSG